MQKRLVFKIAICLLLGACITNNSIAQKFTRADTLRGSLTPERTWFDVKHYALYLIPDYKNKTLSGTNTITFKALRSAVTMQLDLQGDMKIDKITLQGEPEPTIKKEGAAHFITFKKMFVAGKDYSITVQFSGKPAIAKNPPWDGGLIFTKDAKGRPWISTACQGDGASLWWPCKDHQSDEPDDGTTVTIETDGKLKTASNGKKTNSQKSGKNIVDTWQVTQPINSYNTCMNIGNYVTFTDTFNGLKGVLPLTYHVLDYNLDKAKKQFEQVKPMLKAFEFWFGPYPFYEDGYQLIETPFLGMEHQSGVAYGNQYMNGYLGGDISGSGWGKKFDFIIIHESGHEWFGNNISTKDIADMWVHEGFTNYSEVLFTEYYYGKKAANEYVKGLRRGIRNDKPIIGPYDVNIEGSGDMYPKGANLIHTLRTMINDDSTFRQVLIEFNKHFYHKTITSVMLESYLIRRTGINFAKVFDQYLRSTKIPTLITKLENGNLMYKWENVIHGFDMALRTKINDASVIIVPSTEYKTHQGVTNFYVEDGYYINIKNEKSQ